MLQQPESVFPVDDVEELQDAATFFAYATAQTTTTRSLLNAERDELFADVEQFENYKVFLVRGLEYEKKKFQQEKQETMRKVDKVLRCSDYVYREKAKIAEDNAALALRADRLAEKSLQVAQDKDEVLQESKKLREWEFKLMKRDAAIDRWETSALEREKRLDEDREYMDQMIGKMHALIGNLHKREKSMDGDQCYAAVLKDLEEGMELLSIGKG